jgi:hypothetical protein
MVQYLERIGSFTNGGRSDKEFAGEESFGMDRLRTAPIRLPRLGEAIRTQPSLIGESDRNNALRKW